MKTFFKICLLLTSLVGASTAAPQSRVLSIGEDFSVARAAFSTDGRFLGAVTSSDIHADQRRDTFRLFDAQSGKALADWPLRDLLRFAFAPDGRTLATITGERGRYGVRQPYAVEIRDLRTGALRRSLMKAGTFNAALYSLCWSPDGKFVAAGSGDGRVRIWNARTGQKAATLQVGGFINALAWSPQRKLLAIGNQQGAQLWDWAKGRRVALSRVSGGVDASLQFAPDGKVLLSKDNDELLRLLAVPKLAQLAQSSYAVAPYSEGYSKATFSRDGTRVGFYLGSASDRALIVTDASLKRQMFRFRLVDWQVKALNLTSDHQLRWVSVNGANDDERKTFSLWRTRVD